MNDMVRSLFIFILFNLLATSCEHQRNRAEPHASDSAITTTYESIKAIESYREVDPAKIEQINLVLSSGRHNSDEEVMRVYAPKYANAEGKYSYQLSKTELPGGLKELTLVEDGLMDDAVMGRKVIMILDTKGNKLKLISIKETFKCWPGRGHESWSSEACK